MMKNKIKKMYSDLLVDLSILGSIMIILIGAISICVVGFNVINTVFGIFAIIIGVKLFRLCWHIGTLKDEEDSNDEG